MAYSTGTLAKGCFGKVYRQKYNKTWAAVKKVPQQLIERKDLERECEVYNKAEHPNIVKLLGNITVEDGKWVIPLEFIFGEDLETTIFQPRRSKLQLTPSNKATIITGMCEGLLHLHQKDIVHQDLKPENIMVEHKTYRAVIIDLGLAKFFRHGLNSAIDMGNEAYSAPEVLMRRSQRNQRSDVWAMGKIIAELHAVVRLYTPTVGPPKIKETMEGHPLCDTVCKMVEPDPFRRATMAGVIDDIRTAGKPKKETSTPAQKDLLKPLPADNFRLPQSPAHRDVNLLDRNQHQHQEDLLKPLPADNVRLPPSPAHRGVNLLDRNPHAANRLPSPFDRLRGHSPVNKDRSPLNFERTPRPEMKPLRPNIGQHITKPTGVLAGRAGATPDLMRLRLNQGAARDVPSNLPETGKMRIRRIEQNDGKIETWERTIVTQDGKIIKYDDVKVYSN